MVEKSVLFRCHFLHKISIGKKSASFLLNLKANENIRGGFPLLVTLKTQLLQDYSP